MKENKQIIKNILRILLKVIFILTIFFALFYFKIINLQSLYGILSHPLIIIAAFFILLTIFILNAFRWKLLLSTQGLDFPFLKLLGIICISAFSNIFLPGSSSGDAVRLIYTLKESPNAKIAASSSIIVDRFLGVLGLITTAMFIVIINYKTVLDHSSLSHFAQIICILFIMLLIFTCILLNFSKYLLKTNFIKSRKERNLAWKLIHQLLDIAANYQSGYSKILIAWGISIIIHSLALSIFILIAVALNIKGLSIVSYSIATVFSILANTISITPGGIGIGEGSFDHICKLLDTSASGFAYGTAFFIFRTLSVLTVAILAIPFIFLYKKSNQNP